MQAKLFDKDFFTWKTYLLDDQARQAKLSSQLINLPGAQSQIETPADLLNLLK